ncbi:hypothetical protein MGN70_004618 [Eutypa lata]|nr:hypothetical protein MGN70_004618 [Eutypa lata]
MSNTSGAELTNISESRSPKITQKPSLSALQEDVGATSSEYESRQSYLKGPRLHFITVSLFTCLFLTNLEIPIATTALVHITEDLGGFDKSSWVISAYLLGYVGVLVIFAKLSDIFGRKLILLVVILIFAVFSGACGAAQSIEQLVPPALVTAVIIFFSIPTGFPFHGKPKHEPPNAGNVLSRRSLQRLDVLGTALLLVSTVFLVASLEEAGLRSPWRSPFVITLLTISGLGWIAFLLWERRITMLSGLQEPVFPWRLAQSRVWVGMLLNALFLGAPFFCTIFQLPQRLQIVNALSSTQAGVRFIPFTLATPFGSAIASTVAKALKVPPIYLVLFASILQVIGLALMSTLPTFQPVTASQYGYEIIAGFGCGINIALLLLMAPFCVQERDKAVAMGTVTQFRIMGGAIGLAIVTTAFNGLVTGRLGEQLTQGQLAALLQSPATISTFPENVQETIRATLGEGYNLQMAILSGLAAGQIPASFLMWQKKQITV